MPIDIRTQSSEDVARRLGVRSDDSFGPGYERVAKFALTRIFQSHVSVEAYVKGNFSDLLQSGQAGLEVKYNELLVNARTADGVMRAFRGSNPDDLYNYYVLELNVGQIARYGYARSTGNHQGAKHLGGFEGGLLPETSITRVQTYTNAQAKLATELGGGRAAAGPKGEPDTVPVRSGFVAVEESVCHYCRKKGHIAVNCPRKAEGFPPIKNEDGEQ